MPFSANWRQLFRKNGAVSKAVNHYWGPAEISGYQLGVEYGEKKQAKYYKTHVFLSLNNI